MSRVTTCDSEFPAATPVAKRGKRVVLLFEFKKAVDRRLAALLGISAWHPDFATECDDGLARESTLENFVLLDIVLVAIVIAILDLLLVEEFLQFPVEDVSSALCVCCHAPMVTGEA